MAAELSEAMETGAGAGPAKAKRLATREDALANLNEIAEYFRRTEPQSPLAYTIDEAIRRGRLTWPELIAELVKDDQVRGNILTSLGIKVERVAFTMAGGTSGSLGFRRSRRMPSIEIRPEALSGDITMSGSVHSKLNRVRKPRVHITYEVETDGAQIVRELPFVVGVMGDFSGDPTQPLRPMTDRKFTQIDRDNFNDVMARMAPGLNIKVDNTLADDGSEMALNLKFTSMDDFDPPAWSSRFRR